MPPGGQMCHCSQGLCELMHLGPPSVLPFSSLLERLAEEDRTALECARAELLQAPGLLTLDARLDYGGVASTVLHFRLESTLADDGETLRLRGTAQDVTAARAAEEHIAFLAHYDVLTGLPNRAGKTDSSGSPQFASAIVDPQSQALPASAGLSPASPG